MEGSPVRGQERSSLARLSKSRDMETFQAELIRITNSEVHGREIFVGFFDSSTKNLQIPAWVKSHLERHPSLFKKLEQGEMTGISHSEENPILRPASAARSSVVLIPLAADGVFQGVIGLVSPMDIAPLTAEEVEVVRQLAYDASPIMARLQEIEALRRDMKNLRTAANRAEDAEQSLAAVVEQKNELDAVIQMRSHLQANVAHELRTPLAAIRGYTRMILDGRGGEINTTQREYLRIVTENTNRLIGLISWMSYVAELSAQHLKLSRFDLRDVWGECVKSAQDVLTEKSLQLVARIPEESFVMVGDQEKLSFVFSELIAAAAKFSDGSGTISADFSHGREKEVTIKISEKGASIPLDVLNRIFERPFNTISRPPVQDAPTDVINLSSVYDIVGMHGGRVFVNSTAGQGATFLFTLPAVSMGNEENSHEQAINSGRRRR